MNQVVRPNWEQYALALAFTAASRSEDPYRKVGAVVLSENNNVLGVGYNGAPAGIELDWTDRDDRRRYVIHAEYNALIHCNTKEAHWMATTLSPCSHCLKLIAAAGIKKIIYSDIYEKDGDWVDISQKYAILTKQVKFNPYEYAQIQFKPEVLHSHRDEQNPCGCTRLVQ